MKSIWDITRNVDNFKAFTPELHDDFNWSINIKANTYIAEFPHIYTLSTPRN